MDAWEKLKIAFWIVVILLLASGVLLINFFGVPSNGTHTGTVTATETNTLFGKTMTAYFKTNIQSSQEDSYCVRDSQVFQQLKDAQEAQKTVTISFENPIFVFKNECWNGISIITKVG